MGLNKAVMFGLISSMTELLFFFFFFGCSWVVVFCIFFHFLFVSSSAFRLDNVSKLILFIVNFIHIKHKIVKNNPNKLKNKIILLTENTKNDILNLFLFMRNLSAFYHCKRDEAN